MFKSLVPLAFIALLAAAPPARADVPPPETWACQNQNEGAACDLDERPGVDGGGPKRGTCRKSTCSRLDYANWNRDASATPPTMMYECLKCTAAPDGGAADGPAPAPDGAGPAADGPTVTSDAAGASADAPAVIADAAAAIADAAAADAGAPPKADDSGCALGGASHRRSFGPWLLAGAVSALIFFTRRRRR